MAVHVGTVGPVLRVDNMEPEVLRQLALILSGNRPGILNGADLAVTQHGAGAMSVDVAAGMCLIPGLTSPPVQGMYHLYNDAVTNLAVNAADPSHPRIDVVCATVDDGYYAGALNTGLLQVITGAPAVAPVVPALPANTDSVALAHLWVGTGVISVLTANINTVNATDTFGFVPPRCVGLLGTATTTGGTVVSTVVPGALIPGMQVVVNVASGRNVKVSYSVPAQNSNAVTFVSCLLYRDGATLIDGGTFQGPSVANGYNLLTQVAIDTPPAGVHTYAVNAYSFAANTMTFTAARGRLVVDDDGPI